MEGIKIAKIEVWIKDGEFTALYSDEGGGCGRSEECDYIEEAVKEAVEVAKTFRMNDALMKAAKDLYDNDVPVREGD